MTAQVLKNEATDLAPDVGLRDKTRHAVAHELSAAVSDAYRLLINTQGVHWNVEGPLFYSIHKLTEEQYEDLFEAIDDLAERIRALGLPAPESMSSMGDLSQIEDLPSDGTLRDKVAALTEANELIAQRLRKGVQLAEEMRDVKTADLLTDRIGVHESNAWMLRATIAES